MDTLANWNKEGGNFDSLPASATGQYDRLYNAYLNGGHGGGESRD